MVVEVVVAVVEYSLSLENLLSTGKAVKRDPRVSRENSSLPDSRFFKDKPANKIFPSCGLQRVKTRQEYFPTYIQKALCTHRHVLEWKHYVEIIDLILLYVYSWISFPVRDSFKNNLYIFIVQYYWERFNIVILLYQNRLQSTAD